MQPKNKKILLTLSLILLILTLSCKQKEPETSKIKETQTTKETPPKTLSELQTTACNAADSAGTCNSRLVEVGIVEKEECCKLLGKCC